MVTGKCLGARIEVSLDAAPNPSVSAIASRVENGPGGEACLRRQGPEIQKTKPTSVAMRHPIGLREAFVPAVATTFISR